MLKFNRKEVTILLRHTLNAKSHREHFGENAKPGLWLVGDEGVYLMSNGLPAFPGEDKVNKVCYAKGFGKHISNDIMEERKRNLWGGDDGVVFIPVKTFLNGESIEKFESVKGPFIIRLK